MKADDIIEMFAKGGSGKSEGPPEAADPVDALVQALEESGQPLKLWKAKGIARDAQGITRMGVKRWEKILKQGSDAGLFVVGEKFLTLPEESEEPPEAEPARPALKVDFGDAPEGWVPPRTFKCGCTNFLAPEPNDPVHAEARENGFCCAEARSTAATQRGALDVDWQVRGLREAVPELFRRTRERHSSPGFPGLCCSPTTNLYIGGVGNDCRYAQGEERCVVHAKTS